MIRCIQTHSPSLAIQTFHEEGCEGLGCNIAGNADCRQCVFDNTAYAAVSRPFYVISSACANSCQQKASSSIPNKKNEDLLPRSRSTDCHALHKKASTTSARNKIPPKHASFRNTSSCIKNTSLAERRRWSTAPAAFPSHTSLGRRTQSVFGLPRRPLPLLRQRTRSSWREAAARPATREG